MRKRTTLLPGLLLGLALACGGGSNPTATPPAAPVPAQGLAYTDPTGTGWRLLRDATSTSTRLVLNLVGPAGLKTRGVGFNLQAPPSVRFGTFTRPEVHASYTGWPINDTGVYDLRNTDPRDPWTGEPVPPDPLDPILIAGGVKKGNLLTVGIFQKDRRATAKESGVPLCQIALEFDASAKLHAHDVLPLSIVKSKYIAEDIGVFSSTPTVEMVDKGRLVTMTIAVGSLHAN